MINSKNKNYAVIAVYSAIVIILISIIFLFAQQLMAIDLQQSTQQLFSRFLDILSINNNDNINSQWLSALILLLLLSLATSIGLPRQIAAFIAGINLGALTGVIIATLAATIGCLITFTLARFFLSNKVTAKYPEKIAKLSLFINQQTLIKTIIIRLLPVGSNLLTNILAGVTQVSMPRYVIGSFIGFIPQMAIFSLAGSGIRMGAQNEIILSALLFILAIMLSVFLYKKQKKSTSNEADLY